ncbi:LysR family transcriptional regulator [Ruegeria sp. 2205SS24-7]|uniref:LysR family transcriptional regulator n=1 Tax=Ruegeria discodermiae TaxID=3064389 RepID=UPI0027408AE9|nr:LysR family transcriptional regulator [Ruegeria sp. 2205SS24-7]MDP5218758.1 LysR family transcriptional regulator [Ruegeria sp. 2205SS24-7]
MNLNWDDIRILLALVRSGSLTRASQFLEIDQTTVGRRLSSLERALGATLFLRSKSGLIPTETGEKIIADALEIERRADRIVHAASEQDDEPIGEICILGEHWILQHLAAHFLPSLMSAHPKLTIRLISQPEGIASRTAATVSLWFENPPQLGEFAIKLVDVPFALFAKKASNCNETGWVAVRNTHASRRATLTLTDKLRKRDEPMRVLADDPKLIEACINRGLGKGLLPVCLARQNRDLERVGGSEAEVSRRLHLHAHPDTVQSHRVQTIIRRLREEAAAIFSAEPSVSQHQSRPRKLSHGTRV